MKTAVKIALVGIIALSSTLAMAAKEVNTKDFSGWLEEYDSLVFSEDLNAFLFFNEEARGKYQGVIIEAITIFIKDGEKNTKIADEASEYMTKGAKEIASSQGILATEPGPGILRYRAAITGAEKSKEGLKAHNIIPVSAIFRGAQEVTGNVATYIDVMFEGEMVDSVTGKRVAAIVRKGIGETDKRSGDEVGFEDVQPTLDAWLEQWSETIKTFMASRK